MIHRYSSNNPLRRLGKKKVLIPKLSQCAPANFDSLISLFYGTGAFENTYIGQVKYLFANDFDNHVFNLYHVLKHKPTDLINEIEMLPVGEGSWQFYKKYKDMQLSDIENAMFFLYYSNFGFLGKGVTLRYSLGNNKKNLLINIKNFIKEISTNEKTEIQYLNNDFRDVFKKIAIRDLKEKNKTFIYADPPYVETINNYDTPEWTINDFSDLVNLLMKQDINFMISEFNNSQIIEIAEKNNLQITYLGERRNLKNRKAEIIITNYQVNIQKKLF